MFGTRSSISYGRIRAKPFADVDLDVPMTDIVTQMWEEPFMASAEAGLLEDAFLARKVHLLDQYRARLEALDIVSDARSWEALTRNVDQVFLDCARALSGEPKEQIEIDVAADPGDPADQARPVAPARARVRAATILFEVLFEALWDAVDGHPDRGRILPELVLALNRTVGASLEARVSAEQESSLELVRAAGLTSRGELAREIHDRIGNGLSLAMRLLEVDTVTARNGPDSARNSILAVRNVLADTLNDLGKVIRGLRGQQVGQGLRAELVAFVESMRLPEPTVSIRVVGEETGVSTPILEDLFLILRECLRNVFAHARARHVVVAVTLEPDGIYGLVEDDGIGFDHDRVRRSGRDNGLASMTDRAQTRLGSVSFRPVPSGGTRVEVWIPIPRR